MVRRRVLFEFNKRYKMGARCLCWRRDKVYVISGAKVKIGVCSQIGGEICVLQIKNVRKILS